MTIVVDGGGSGSRLALFNADGQICATAKSGPASLSLGEAAAWESIAQGINSLRRSAGAALPELRAEHWLPQTLIMGLAGALQQQRRAAFLAMIPDSVTTHLVTDGHAQLVGASNGQPGVCLAVGTGSVVHWLDERGQNGMAGGWGFPAGDEASGAWLGMHAIAQYLQYRDALNARLLSPESAMGEAVMPTDPLYRACESQLGSAVSDIQQWSTCKSPTTLATLAPLILAAEQQGSDVAKNLIADGARACEALLSLAPADLPVYMVGGLAPIYAERLTLSYRSRLREPLGDALDGLYTLLSECSFAAQSNSHH